MAFGILDRQGEKRLVLGSYPVMTLQEARDARDEARRLIAKGIDPSIAKKQRAAAQLVDSAATLRSMAEAWLEEQRPRWSGKHAHGVRASLEKDIFPHLGSVPLSQITKAMVLQRLKAIEACGAVETAKRLRQRIEEIYAYADGIGHEVKSPAAVTKSLRPLIKGKRAGAAAGAAGSERVAGAGSVAVVAAGAGAAAPPVRLRRISSSS